MNLNHKPLAMAYVPWQTFENVSDPACGLEQGTIFEDLVFPFVGAQAACQAPKKPMYYPPNCSCGKRGGY